jgi:hypothetical protein
MPAAAVSQSLTRTVWAFLPAPLRADSEGGWAWAHDPTGSYSPFPEYSWNSSGGAITIRNVGIGRYDVRFEGLGIWNGGNGGNVQVNAYGGSGYCKTQGWFSDSSGVSVQVLCFSAGGTAANHRFTVAYTRYSGNVPDDTAYVWNDLVASSGTPETVYQWDSTGFEINVRYEPPGDTYVQFPRLRFRAPLLTAYGTDNATCSWAGGHFGLPVEEHRVTCVDPGGARVPSRFTMSVGRAPVHAPSWGQSGVTGNGASKRSLIRVGGVEYEDVVSDGRYGTGHYWVKFPYIDPEPSSLALVSQIQAATLSPSRHRCRASWWGLSASGDGMAVEVRCYDSAGAPVDSIFNVVVAATNEVPIN